MAPAARPATHSDDVSTLKRLLREAFSDLLKVRSRLEELERVTGISGAADQAPSDATQLSGSQAPEPRAGRQNAQQRRRRALTGAIRLGGGLLWAQVRLAALGAAWRRPLGGIARAGDLWEGPRRSQAPALQPAGLCLTASAPPHPSLAAAGRPRAGRCQRGAARSRGQAGG